MFSLVIERKMDVVLAIMNKQNEVVITLQSNDGIVRKVRAFLRLCWKCIQLWKKVSMYTLESGKSCFSSSKLQDHKEGFVFARAKHPDFIF